MASWPGPAQKSTRQHSVPAEHPGTWVAGVPFQAAQVAGVAHSPPTATQRDMNAGDSAAGTTSDGVRADAAAGCATGASPRPPLLA